MDVALAQDDELLAVHLDVELVVGAEQHPVGDLDGAHVVADSDTSPQSSRLATSAVAGIRMPPVDLRSPSPRGSFTSTRSCNILIGSRDSESFTWHKR